MKLFKIVVGIGLLGGCLPPPELVPNYGPPPSPQQATEPAGETCMQVFECLAGCQDAACFPGCLDRGSGESRAAATAVLACNSTGVDCQSELSTCRNQGQVVAQDDAPLDLDQPAEEPPAGDEEMMPGQPHTTANLLPWLTGYWQGVYYHYDFYGDGRVKRSSGTSLYTESTGRYACASIVNEIGTVRQEGDLLIMDFTTASANHCGDEEAAPGRTLRLRITWYQYLGPVALKLVDIDCHDGACSDPITRKR